MNTNRKIFTAIIVFFLIVTIASFLIVKIPQFKSNGLSEKIQPFLPANVTSEIEKTRSDERSFFSRWEANETEHLVIIYLNCSIRYGNMKPDMNIDNWTVRRVQDPEIFNETAMDECENYINNWAKDHPRQHVGAWTPDSCRKTVYVKVINITSELIGSEAMVEGWRIIFVQAT